MLAPPYGLFYYDIDKDSFAAHPYRRPTIGSIEDLDASTLADVQKFHTTYYRPDNTSDWYVYGAIFGTGSKPSFVKLDPVSTQNKMCQDANGDLMASEFNPDGTLDVVWTRNTDPTTCGTVTVRDIYFARSR